MAEQNIYYTRNPRQNEILDLEKHYMEILEGIITSDNFIEDLKNIEQETQEYYELLNRVWGKKNKIKEASERLLRHHMYTNFPKATKFYPSPISCDIALELDNIILNIDVKTIDKVGNSGELNSTQLEHNQTSFVNNPVLSCTPFSGFKVQSNLKSIDPRTNKPILTYLVKIGYADNGKNRFNLLNTSLFPSLTLTCLPNGSLSELFDYDLFRSFKDYIYYNHTHGHYYKPMYITTKEDFNSLNDNGKFLKIETNNDIPQHWQRVIINNKVGYYDNENNRNQLWWVQEVKPKNQKHWDIYLKAVRGGNTARFNDEWLEKRYDSQNRYWSGQRKYYNIYN